MPPRDWFSEIRAGRELSVGAVQNLREFGFVVIPGPVAPAGVAQLAAAYDAAMASANPADTSIGSPTTRVHGFVERGPQFDALYLHQPVLEAGCHTIGRPFKLSSLLGRTLRPRTQGQALHVDFRRDMDGWPMLGFIFMVDEFRNDNGATRFVPGSHEWSTIPSDPPSDPVATRDAQVVACGPADSVIVYNGSVWHGHTANSSEQPRRSIQGAYVRREASSGGNLPPRVRPATLARLSPLARYLLDAELACAADGTAV